MAQNPTILIVVDNDEIRSALSHLLKINDYRLIEAISPEDAVLKVSDNSIGLILIDMNKPLREGLAAARRIRESAARRDLPVLIVDGETGSSREVGAATNSDEYVIKVIDLDQLMNLLSYILRQYSNAA